MDNNNFIIDFIAGLHKSKSKKQVQSDAKNLGEIKVPLIGTLSKAKTRAQLKQDLASLNGTINLTGKINQKGIVTSVQQATSQAQAAADKKSIQVSMNLKKDKLINDIKILGQQNTKMFKDANMSAKYNSLLDNAKLATSNKEIANLRLQLSAMRSEIKATNLSGLTLGDTFKKTFKRATELFTGTGGVMLLSQQMRKAWTEAIYLDKAYTNLIKVQDELSRGDYPTYLEQCNKKAQELASTQKALIEGATEFSKSGYTKTISDNLSEVSTILANVGNMSASDSAKAIISGVQAYDVVDGYDDVIDKASALIDKYNEIGNTASITTGEIAKGVQAVGSVFADANTSVDEFIALLAAGNRQYQDADALALGLRTAALRIRGCTAELEMMNEETEGVYTSASKLAEKIEGLTNVNGNGGVKILEDDEETFRSIYDIFLDISKVYQQMSDTDQSALLELIAGKHRASAISATLNNMSEAQEIYQRSLESAGSAQREYDKYLSSSEAALNRFKASMTETYQSVIDGQTVTGLLNCGNATLQFVNSLGLVESTLKGLIAIGVVKVITTLSAAFKASAIQASNFGTALNTVKSMSAMAKGTTEYSNALKTLKAVSVGLSETQLKQVLASKALSESDRIAILRTTGLTKAQAQAKLAQMGLTQSTQAQTTANASATASTFSLTAAVKGFGASLKAAFMSNPVGIAIMALSTVIGMVTSAIDSANQKAEEARQKAKDAADTASTLSNEISELTGKYLTLSNAVQTDKSSKEDLMTVQEELIKKLGIEGETIDSLIAKYGSLDEAIKQVTLDELGNMENDLVAGVKAAEDELKEIGKDYEHFYSLTNRNLLSSSGEDAVRAYSVLNEAGIIDKGSYGTGGGSIVLTGDDSTVEGILENYQKLQDAMKALRESDEFTEEELKDNPVFLQIYNRVQEMREFVDGYNDAITDLNQNVAQQQMLSSLKGMELPDTEEEFNTFRDNLVKTAQSSNEFIGSQKDIEEAINGYLATVPQFAGYYNEIEIAVGDASAQAQSAIPLFNQLTSSEEELDKFQSSVKSATDAYATLLSGNYTSTELLDSIQAINKAVSDMGGSLNWEFINSQTDSLELLGDAIQHISQKYAESILLGAGIDIDSEFGQMLADMITQAFEAEAAFEGMNSQLDDLQSSYQTLTEVLESYNKTGYISIDSLQSLLTADENLIAMLEVENGQLVLNQAAYENLVAVQLLEFKAKLNDAAAAEIETLAKQKAEQATNQNADASQNAVAKLDAETQAFNRNTSAAIANAVAKAEESGVSEEEIQGVFDKYTEVWNSAMSNYNVDFDSFMSGGKSAASKAGGEAGDAYVKAFEKEYSNLKDMLNRGEISEAQYLNRLRALYNKYFRDRKKYLSEYKKYESEYLTGMLDLHNKALSGISTLLNRKISAANDAKDASISALQEEKEAAADAYQAQIDAIEKEKDAIDDLIKEKNKKIASINEEIDAIERAAESRKKNIQLEKDQYNLEKMLNNRSSLVYKDGQFIWDTDTRGIRDAREKVREDQEALRIDGLKNEISLIQKEIDLLEEKKDSLSEEQDRIQKLMDESNKSYDNLIKQQEKYWDSIIKGMEQNKSRWEELAEVEEIAKAFSYIQQVFGDLGYTVEDVLNGSDEAFEDFKSRYISLISDVNNNSDFTEGLVYATGVAKENLGSFLDKTKEAADGLDELGGKGSEMDSVAESMDKLSESATTASTSTGEIVSNMGELNTNTEGLSDNLNGIGDALTDIPEADKFDTLTTSFTNLGEAIKSVASALGVGEEGTVGGLVGALQLLSELSLGEEETGIVSQFNNLKTAVEGVTNAISGGGSSGGGKSGDASGSSSASMSAGAGGEGASGLVGAIEEFKSATDEALGGGGESGEGEGSGSGGTGAIPQFKELETAVNDVTTAIGSGESEGAESSGEGESDNLIGSIVNLGETSTETLGESDGDGVIGKFNEFKGVIEEAANQVKSISEGLDEIDGKEVECTITVNVKMNGSIPAFASGTVLGNMQIESATYNAKYGKAFASGTIGLPKAEKNALVSEYGQTEMTVLPDGKTIITDTPTMMDLPKDTVIYNEEQTKKIMDNKVDASGKAHANGTDESIWTTLADGTKVRELQPGDKMYDMMQKFDAYFKSMDGNLEKLVPNSFYDHQKQMEDMAKQINYVSNISNNNKPSVNIGDINVTCPGVTSQQVAEQLGGVIGKELDKQFSGFHNWTDQMSRIR